MADPRSFQRRHLLAGSASAVAAGLCGSSGRALAQPSSPSLPAYAGWKDPGSLIVHSAQTMETRRGAFGSAPITPADRLYVRNNLPAPDASIVADRDAWSVVVEGVKQPRTLSVRELKTLGVETVAAVLQCSGNGRGFCPAKPSGTPWTVGAAGCVFWTGVPLKAVAAALGGVDADMRYITGTGGEKLPEGVDPKSVVVERSVPIRALEDALLEFAGSVMVISHDRWFLDRIATHILSFEGDSQVVFFNGNYQEYEADKKKRLGEEGAKPKRIRYKPISR